MRDLFSTIAEDSRREAEWLDLLSQMEYVGCRKIVRAMPFDSISFDVLQHIAEEAQHAFLLKSLVEKAGLRRRSWTESPLAPLGWKYFQSLDHQLSQLQEDARAHYPATSWAVERRALQIYPAYAAATKNVGVKRVISQILAQERRHGDKFDRMPFPDWFRSKAIAIEAKLWQDLFDGLMEWVTGPVLPGNDPISAARMGQPLHVN